MILREFKVWGRKREEKDSLYIWAKDADDAIGIARLTDQSICISQWTGNEKSIKLVKEVTGMSLDWDDAHYEALQMAIKALEKEPSEDAISRQVVVEYIKASDADLGHDSENEFVVEDILNMPPVTPTQKWIPCSERLPEAPGFVNCTCHSLIDNREDWVVETFYMPHPSGSPYSDWGNIPMLNDGKCEVVAWMYRNIPEPYKAESEDKE